MSPETAPDQYQITTSGGVVLDVDGQIQDMETDFRATPDTISPIYDELERQYAQISDEASDMHIDGQYTEKVENIHPELQNLHDYISHIMKARQDTLNVQFQRRDEAPIFSSLAQNYPFMRAFIEKLPKRTIVSEQTIEALINDEDVHGTSMYENNDQNLKVVSFHLDQHGDWILQFEIPTASGVEKLVWRYEVHQDKILIVKDIPSSERIRGNLGSIDYPVASDRDRVVLEFAARKYHDRVLKEVYHVDSEAIKNTTQSQNTKSDYDLTA